MSSCLILQAKDKLYIGADTSSSVFIDDKLYRLNNNTKKLFLLDNNTVLYCAGNNSIAEKVFQHISSIYRRNDFSLISLKNWLAEKYPYRNNNKTIYDVEILIATFKDRKTIVYQMSQYKNYDIVSFEVSDAGVQILSAGIKNAECMSFAENKLLNKSGVKSIFRTTFNNLSCNYIGGCLDLYEITKNGAVKIFDNERINEHGIQYVHDVFNGLSVSLNAEVLVSKLVMSENLWIENNSGNYKFNDSGFTATNGNNTIKIQPNNSGELFSIYKGSNKQVYINSSGDVEFAGTLKSASGQFSGLVSGGSIDIGGGVFTVDKDGKMTATSCNITGNISSSTITGAGISGSTINGTNIIGGTISGATFTTTGTFGTTVISGGNITSKANDSTSSFLSMSSGDFESKFMPQGLHFYEDCGSYDKYVYIYPNGITLTTQCSTVDGKPATSIIDPDYVQSNDIRTLKKIYFDYNATTTGTSSGTTNYRLYKAGNPYGTGGNENIPTAGWVKGYVANNSPSVDTSNFASKNHTHSNYVSYASYSFSDSPTTKYAPRYFNVYGNNLSVSGLLISTSSSDERLKNNIQPLRDIENFYMHLNPVEYVWKNGYVTTQKGLQFGLVAQDVENELQEYGISNSGLVLKEVAEEDEKSIHGDDITYKLDKEQLHAMHIQMIQKHQYEIETLKQQIEELKETINK